MRWACGEEGRFVCESCSQIFINCLQADEPSLKRERGLEVITASSKLTYQCIVVPDGVADAIRACAAVYMQLDV